MADGINMHWRSDTSAALSLSAAIALLESGGGEAGLTVRLGPKAFATLDRETLPSVFLARLQAHARLCELAGSAPQDGGRAIGPVEIDPEAKALLDAVRKSR